MLNDFELWWSISSFPTDQHQPWSFPCSKSQLAPSRSLATSCHLQHASVAEGHIVKSKEDWLDVDVAVKPLWFSDRIWYYSTNNLILFKKRLNMVQHVYEMVVERTCDDLKISEQGSRRIHKQKPLVLAGLTWFNNNHFMQNMGVSLLTRRFFITPKWGFKSEETWSESVEIGGSLIMFRQTHMGMGRFLKMGDPQKVTTGFKF